METAGHKWRTLRFLSQEKGKMIQHRKLISFSKYFHSTMSSAGTNALPTEAVAWFWWVWLAATPLEEATN